MNVEKILQAMTLEEKAALCAGRDGWHTRELDRLGVPAVMMADGPHGLRKELDEGIGEIVRDSYPATCFPTASALASTWNRDLVGRVGSAIADECLAEGVNTILGPGANIKRSPLCGRNFEYFSEDPYLTGEMATAYIQGVQKLGVGTSLKHFAANNQEYRRMLIDAVVDERALREIYLAGFEQAVKKSKPWTVMAAYNKLNGTYCTENKTLLTNILRDEWGFEGMVVSDWGAVNDRVLGIEAGMDLEMPGIPNGNKALIIAAVKAGALTEGDLDAAVRRILQFVDKCRTGIKEGYQYDFAYHHQIALEAAAEGAVLLKNADSILPLKKGEQIALIGRFAKEPRYQGSGSSLIHPTNVETLFEAVLQYTDTEKVLYADGFALDGGPSPGPLREEAISIAKQAGKVIICAGLTDMDEVESIDRDHLRLPEVQNQLIEAVAQVNPNVIIVLSGGAPVEMPWINAIPAILKGYLGGQAGARAHGMLLFGDSNPSGKLAETFPLALADTPTYNYFPGGPKTVEYRESIFVGYRFFDMVKKEVLFPFGHGLSYTTFAYSGLRVNMNQNQSPDVIFTIENTGDTAGKEIAQVYVHHERSSVYRPEQELKQFTKVTLQPGEKKTVTLSLDERSFSYYSPEEKRWIVEAGEYVIRVGASSRDIRLVCTISIDGESRNTDPSDGCLFYKDFPENAVVPVAAFENILRRPVPDNDPDPKPYTINTPIMDMQASLVGRILRFVVRKQINKIVHEDMHRPTRLMIEQMALESPLRVLIMFSGGTLNPNLLDGLLMIANGKILNGITAMLRSSLNKQSNSAH